MKLPNFLETFFKNIFLRTFFLLLAVLEAKAGAKIRHIFETSKFFGNFFQKLFLRTFPVLSEGYPYLIAGAKVTLIFYSASIL